MKKQLTLLFFALSSIWTVAMAQEVKQEQAEFRFVAGKDMFFSPWQGNQENLQRLTEFIQTHKSVITSGGTTISVNGYCADNGSEAERRQRVKTMSNRVKSEIIRLCGVTEAHFTTRNALTSYEGHNNVVVVHITLPVAPTEPQPNVEAVQEEPVIVDVTPETKPEEKPQPQPEPETVSAPAEVFRESYRPFSLRTNLLYDALLLPTLGVEWRISECFALKLDGSYSYWGGKTGNVQKIWMLNPEVRYYLGHAKQLYIGVGGNYGKYNVYKGLLGNLLSKDTGYQGSLWNAGATAGYALPLGRAFALDFNVGVGYNSFSYDTFGITDGVRVYKDRDRTKNAFGITQAGVSFVWKW